MKSGASDPFADDDDEADDENASPAQSSPDASTGEERSASGSDESTPEAQAGETEPAASGSDGSNSEADTDADATESEGLSREELPFILRRDKVKDERPEVHQLFVQRETHEEAVDAERALEKRLGEGLSRTDAREAIYLAGMRHLGDAEDILREWGYDL